MQTIQPLSIYIHNMINMTAIRTFRDLHSPYYIFITFSLYPYITRCFCSAGSLPNDFHSDQAGCNSIPRILTCLSVRPALLLNTDVQFKYLPIGHSLIPCARILIFSKFLNFNVYFLNYWTNTRHVGTYLNAFLVVISNIIIKFQNFAICDILVTFWTYRLLTPAAW